MAYIETYQLTRIFFLPQHYVVFDAKVKLRAYSYALPNYQENVTDSVFWCAENTCHSK